MMIKGQLRTPPATATAKVLAGLFTATLVLPGCGGSSSNGGETENGGGDAPEVAAAADIYEGDYNGPTELIPLDDVDDGAAAMDLTYLAGRAHTVLNSLEERVAQSLDDEQPDGTVTVAGDCPQGVEDDSNDGSVNFREVLDPQTPPNNGTLIITSTYDAFDDYCIEKFDTGGTLPGGQLVIRASSEPYIVKETVTFVDGEAEKVEIEAITDNLIFDMRGSQFEMSGKELLVVENNQNAGALAFDLSFEGDSAEQDTVLRFLADIENDLTQEGNIREIEIASALLGGSVQTRQQDTSNFFDNFSSCKDGLSHPIYTEAQQGKVTLTGANEKELIADLSANSNCEKFVLSGGPEGTFTLLNTLFKGP